MADRKLMAVLESGSEWMSALNDQVKELRSRLQALEQNTVPASQAKEKPREWWICRRPDGGMFDTGVMRHAAFPRAPDGMDMQPAGYIRVREVLDE